MDSHYIRLLCPARDTALGQKKYQDLFLPSSHMTDYFSG